MFRPSRPSRPNVNGPSRDQLNKALGISGRGPVWVAGIVANVPQETSQPPVSPTPSPTPTQTSSETPTPTPTNTVTPTSSETPTPTPTNTETPTQTPTPTPSPQPSSVTYITSVADATQKTSYSFSNVNIGGEGLIVVVVQTDINTGWGGTPSVLIDGITSTAAAGQTANGSSYNSTIHYLRVTSPSSTANIDVNFANNNQTGCRISTYRVQNILNDTPYRTCGATKGEFNISCTLTSLVANSIVISCIMTTNGTINWTGPTENNESTLNGIFTSTASIKRTASGNFTTSSGNYEGGSGLVVSVAWN